MRLIKNNGDRLMVELSKLEFNICKTVFGDACKTDLGDIIRQAMKSGELSSFAGHAVLRQINTYGNFEQMTYYQFCNLIDNDDFKIRNVGKVCKLELSEFCKNNPPEQP